METLMFKSIPR